jgi:hypothetical protein
MSMLELRRVSKVCGRGTQRAEAAVMRAQRTANEPTLSRAYWAIWPCALAEEAGPGGQVGGDVRGDDPARVDLPGLGRYL